MNLPTRTALVMLTCLCALPAQARADDDGSDAGKGHQSYYKWFLEELEIGRNRLKSGRGDAISSPIDSPDQPPKHLPTKWYGSFMPYYSAVIPSSTRWATNSYVPYYRGYCKSGKVSREYPYRAEPCPELSGSETPSDRYGAYAGAPQNEEQILRLGGEGPYQQMVPDIIGGGALLAPETVPAPPEIPNGEEVPPPK